MKQTILTLLTFLLLSVALDAQHCAVASVNIPVVPAAGPGLTPLPQDLPCAIVGSAVNDSIYFQNFVTFQYQTFTVTVDSLKIDSIYNLPPGLCWAADRTDNTYSSGQNGTINVTGTCAGPPGQYKLTIIVDVWTNFGHFTAQNAETFAGLRYYVRARCANDTCPNLDTVNGRTQAYIAYPGCSTPPVAIITPAGHDTICPGASATLTATSGTGYTYRWSNAAHSTSQSISVTTAGSYQVTVYNTTDSAVSSPTTIVIGTNPYHNIALSGDSIFCQGDSAVIIGPSDFVSNSTYFYLWNDASATTSQRLTVKTSGSYSVTVTNTYGCTAVSTPFTITVNSGLTDNLTRAGFVLTSVSASSYQWYKGTTLLAGDTSQSITVTQNGTYHVVITSPLNGCVSTSSSVTITNVGINTVPDAIALRLYPNPSEGLFTLEAQGNVGNYYEVTDQVGRVVQKKTIQYETSLVDMSSQLSGIYYLSVKNATQNETIRFVIMK